jgi:hypothetical protein
VVAAPAKPPLNILIKRYLSLSCFIYLVVVKRSLKYYLKENPNACVGKYLTTLTQLPLHNAMTPSSFKHLIKQSTVLCMVWSLLNSIFVFALIVLLFKLEQLQFLR